MALVRCPECDAELDVADADLGGRVECGACGASFAAPRGEDRPRRRPRDRYDLEEAERLVSGPAAGLQVTGWIGIVLSALNFLVAGLMVVMALAVPPQNPPPGQPDPQTEAAINAISSAAGGAIGLAVSVIVVMGANRMKRLENHGFAVVSAVLALLPCLSPCCILGLPYGIMALMALNKPVVKEAFEAVREGGVSRDDEWDEDR